MQTTDRLEIGDRVLIINCGYPDDRCSGDCAWPGTVATVVTIGFDYYKVVDAAGYALCTGREFLILLKEKK